MYAYGMSTTALAEFVGVKSTLMANKLAPRYRNKLSDDDVAGIKEYFQTLQQHLAEFIASDYNEVPRALIPNISTIFPLPTDSDADNQPI